MLLVTYQQAKHVHTTELKLPNHMPAHAANCGFAAHDQTLNARIKRSDSDKPISRNLSETSFHQRQIAKNVSEASLTSLDETPSRSPANLNFTHTGCDQQRGREVKAGEHEKEHDDNSSIASSDSNIAVAPGHWDARMYSIVITPQHYGHAEVALVKSGEEMNVPVYEGLPQQDHMNGTRSETTHGADSPSACSYWICS